LVYRDGEKLRKLPDEGLVLIGAVLDVPFRQYTQAMKMAISRW
jgi:hypothetical protein